MISRHLPARVAQAERLLQDTGETKHLGIAVSLGQFGFEQDERLTDEAAVVHGADKAVDWILGHGYGHVMIEADTDSKVRYDYFDFNQPDPWSPPSPAGRVGVTLPST